MKNSRKMKIEELDSKYFWCNCFLLLKGICVTIYIILEQANYDLSLSWRKTDLILNNLWGIFMFEVTLTYFCCRYIYLTWWMKNFWFKMLPQTILTNWKNRKVFFAQNLRKFRSKSLWTYNFFPYFPNFCSWHVESSFDNISRNLFSLKDRKTSKFQILSK